MYKRQDNSKNNNNNNNNNNNDNKNLIHGGIVRTVLNSIYLEINSNHRNKVTINYYKILYDKQRDIDGFKASLTVGVESSQALNEDNEQEFDMKLSKASSNISTSALDYREFKEHIEYVEENIHEKYTDLLHVEDMGIDNRTLNAPALQVGYYVIVCVPFATHSLLQLSLLSELTSFWRQLT
uniref:Uncharacterized protein n=1 Tax=Glossina pallidipes TaxID=7398 RepID=A0A1B0A900_GLOPL